MKSGPANSPAILLAALAAFVLISCILGGDKVSGKRGSEVENELGVYGVLVDVGGKPVAGASVKARPAAAGVAKAGARSSVSAADSASVFTDMDGRYSFLDLSKGGYDLYGEANAGALVVLIPDVFVRDTARPVPVGEDTLRKPGRIAGRVLAGGKGKPAVLCYIPGTSYLAVTDDSGRFTMSGLPKGVYTVGYSATGFLIVSDSGVAVEPGKTAQLPDKELDTDPALAPPPPESLKAIADTSDGGIFLSWRPVKVSDLKAYVIYRSEPGRLEPQQIGITADTVYKDRLKLPAGEVQALTYFVRALDNGSNLSLSFSEPAGIPVYRADWAYDSFTWVFPKEEILPLQDSIPLIVHIHFPVNIGAKLIWRVAGSGDALKVAYLTSVDLTDTLMWAPKPGIHRIEATIRTDKEWIAGHTFSFLPEGRKPVDAGLDTEAWAGDLIVFESQIDSSLGPVASWEWSSPQKVIPLQSDLNGVRFIAPTGMDSVEFILRITDSSGLTASDTAVARLNRPKGLEWDQIQANPPFPGRTEGAMIAFRDKLWIIGGSVKATVLGDKRDSLLADIWSSSDGVQWNRVLEAAPFGKRRLFGCQVFQDKLWVIGGYGPGLTSPDAWSSADGIHWEKSMQSLPGFMIWRSFVFQNRLWIPDFETLYSTDGFEWMEEGLFELHSFKSSAVLDGKLYIMLQDGYVGISSDAKSWDAKLPKSGLPQTQIALVPFAGGLWVVGETGGQGALWRIGDSDWLELEDDGLPFINALSESVALGDRLFIQSNAVVGGNTVSSIWRGR